MSHQDGLVLQKFVEELELNIGSNAAIFEPFDLPPDYLIPIEKTVSE